MSFDQLKKPWKNSADRFSTSIISLFVFSAFLLTAARAIPASATEKQDAIQINSFKDIPMGAAPVIARAMQKSLPDPYQLKENGSEFSTTNQLHELDVRYTSKGPQFTSGGHTWAMSLSGIGYNGSVMPVSNAKRFNDNGCMVYQREYIAETYINSSWGIEQGFTLRKPPEGKKQGVPLVVEISLSGELQPSIEGNTLVLADTRGYDILHYSGLQVFDRDNNGLPAYFELVDHTLRIVVDDSRAEYPIVIDPWVFKAGLTASDGGDFGDSVAVSGDTIVVGAFYTDSEKGAAYVYVKPSGGWESMTQTAKLLASDGAASDRFGKCVSISGDTILVGATGDDGYRGSAYIFQKPVGGWAGTLYEDAKLTASVRNTYAYFAYSLSISNNTAVVGAYYSDIVSDSEGAAFVFVEPTGETGWTNMTETAVLSTTDRTGIDEFGKAVCISGDTVVVGSHRGNGLVTYSGIAYIFEKPTGGWSTMTTHTAKLVASDGSADDEFGSAVAIDGDTVVVGAFAADSYGASYTNPGEAYVFEKPVSGWSGTISEVGRLVAGDPDHYGYFGYAVDVTGNTVAIFSNVNNGSVYIFDRPASGWTDMSTTDSLGMGSGLAIDGNTLCEIFGIADYVYLFQRSVKPVNPSLFLLLTD